MREARNISIERMEHSYTADEEATLEVEANANCRSARGYEYRTEYFLTLTASEDSPTDDPVWSVQSFRHSNRRGVHDEDLVALAKMVSELRERGYIIKTGPVELQEVDDG